MLPRKGRMQLGSLLKNNLMPFPRGIVSVVQTPFDEGHEIDWRSLERLIEDAISAQVDGLLVPVVASEVAFLREDERHQILQTVMTVAAKRVPVIAGASSPDADLCRQLCLNASDLKVDGCLIAVPVACYANPDLTAPFFQSATRDCPLPLLVQDLEFNGPGLSIDMMRHLADAIPQLSGWKIETVPAGPKYTAVRQAFGPHCFISGGWAVPQFIEALDRGVDAMIPESAMIRVYRAILRKHQNGQRDQALQLFRELLPVLAYTNQELATSIAFFKRLLVRKGIFATPTLRIPGFARDEFNVRITDELIDLYLGIEARLDDE